MKDRAQETPLAGEDRDYALVWAQGMNGRAYAAVVHKDFLLATQHQAVVTRVIPLTKREFLHITLAELTAIYPPTTDKGMVPEQKKPSVEQPPI